MKTLTMPNIDFKAIVEDFRTLNPKNVGAWPLVPRVVILLALFFAILLIGWLLVWSDQLGELEAKQNEEGKLKDEYITKRQQSANLDLYLQQLNDIDRSFGALLKQLPNKAEVESLLVEINQAGMARGVQFDLFKPGQELAKDFYAELPVSVKLTGNYHDFGMFAGDIGRLSRIVTLNNLAVVAAKDGGLVMDAVVKTFRYLDEDEVAAAKQKKAAQAAAAKGGKK